MKFGSRAPSGSAFRCSWEAEHEIDPYGPGNGRNAGDHQRGFG
jgi:hypothetical protein